MIAYKPILFCLSLFLGVQFFTLSSPNTPKKLHELTPDATVSISDSTFNPADWTVIEVVEGGASQINRQESTGGHPGAFRFMQHVLPSPPSPTDVGRIQVTHIYEAASFDPATQGAIDRLGFSEDVGLLNLPYASAFVASSPALVQDGQAYRAASFGLQEGATGWTRGLSFNLRAEDFIALDDSAYKPDFSENGAPIKFGFWRSHTRVGDIPVPYRQNLTINHGIDNFSVTIYTTTPQTGIACHLEPQTFTSAVGLETTRTVTVQNDGQPAGGIIVNFTVTSGPNMGESSTDTTDVAGHAVFTFLGDSGLGTDVIEARNQLVGANFSCIAQHTWTQNRVPIARNDEIVIKWSPNLSICTADLLVLANDTDPDDHSLSIIDVTQPSYGIVANKNDKLVYTKGPESHDELTYTISDKVGHDPNAWLADTAAVTVMSDCGCLFQCATRNCGFNSLTKSALQDTVELDLLRRFRDEVMQPTEIGSHYVDIYYNIPELLYILLIKQPELAPQAVHMVELLQPSLRNVLDGDGNTLITQAQMDSVATFFANLSAAGSESLQQLIDDELTRLGSLDDYVGLPVRDVLADVLGESVGTAHEPEGQPTPIDFVLYHNFPNPFDHTTEIRYALSHPSRVTLTVYNIQGQKVRTLIQENQRPGMHSITWNGLDDGERAVSSGVYLFRLQTPTAQVTKTMVLRK